MNSSQAPTQIPQILYNPRVDTEMCEALDRQIERATFLARPIHRFERAHFLRQAKTPEWIKKSYLLWAALLLNVARPLSRAALWLDDCAEAPLSWTYWDETTPLGQRRRQLLNRSNAIGWPRSSYPRSR